MSYKTGCACYLCSIGYEMYVKESHIVLFPYTQEISRIYYKYIQSNLKHRNVPRLIPFIEFLGFFQKARASQYSQVLQRFRKRLPLGKPSKQMSSTPPPFKNICLVVIDGWGISPTSPLLKNVPGTPSVESLHDNIVKYDAIANANTPVMSSLQESCPTVPLYAHGLAVGLPKGLMGNSEVGHLNIGAGRPVPQDIVRIDTAVEEKTLLNQPALKEAFEAAKNGTGRVHFVGLVSDGGVHSHMDHLKALLVEAQEYGIANAFVHAICDGRDTSPKSAHIYIADMTSFMDSISYGEISSVIGRYYAMDRDKRWERTALAYSLLVGGSGEEIAKSDILSTLSQRYDSGETDEFLKPMLVKKDALLKGTRLADPF